ncbi:hypothetical protein BGW80DRAFT_82278 [Lactifluus volemus]|nr:hypothetical protein BGW80DRAFT_82278 [Lactifluus volemus]
MHFSKLLFSLVVGIPAASLFVLATAVPDSPVASVGPTPVPYSNPAPVPTPVSDHVHISVCIWPMDVCNGSCRLAPFGCGLLFRRDAAQ